MMQKEVRIIGLQVNQQFGILQSCFLKFDENNKLIIIKGEVGSGKTTLSKAISLGTQGSDTLKDDKNLYGNVDQEVQLLDSNVPIFVGCKSNAKGALTYFIYTKDREGKIVKDPVVEGVKLTPNTYLKSLQTALTWRMDELTSENATVQKKLLLELYKKELAEAGVIFDKSDSVYTESILGKLELAENKRANCDFARKEIGGFSKHLSTLGIDTNNPDTIPARRDTELLEQQKQKLLYDVQNIESVKTQKLEGLKIKAKEVIIKLEQQNDKIRQVNRELEKEWEEQKRSALDSKMFKQQIKDNLVALKNNNCLDDNNLQYLTKMIEDTVKLKEMQMFTGKELIPFDENGKCTAENWPEQDVLVNNLLIELKEYQQQYVTVNVEDNSESINKLKEEADLINQNITLANENNKRCDSCDAFFKWQKSDSEVRVLKEEYARKLASINTGVDGLKIEFRETESKLDIYLMYNGCYDPDYFGNKTKEFRKLSSYSGTQKPLICLLLQNYLLSKKPKAMRYLWIDNVPIDKKTKELLIRMAGELNMTLFVNITGDFDKNELKSGEILVSGGGVFFN